MRAVLFPREWGGVKLSTTASSPRTAEDAEEDIRARRHPRNRGAVVFLHHSNTTAFQFRVGLIGVWTFFVLSGFLIVRILYVSRSKIDDEASSFLGEFGTFFAHCTARIFPIYYLTLTVASIFAASGYYVEFFSFDWALAYWTYLSVCPGSS